MKTRIDRYYFGKRSRIEAGSPPKIYVRWGDPVPPRTPVWAFDLFDFFWLSSVGFVPLSSLALMDRLLPPIQPRVPSIEDPLPDFDKAGIATVPPFSFGVWA